MLAADKFNEFRVNKPTVFAKAQALTRDFIVLAKIYDNISLFSSFMRADCNKYADLVEALWNLKDDSVLIYFEELSLYGVFTNSAYLDFCKAVNEKNR